MAENQFIVTFKPDKHIELKNAFEEVRKAQEGLTKSTGKSVSQTLKQSKATENLTRELLEEGRIKHQNMMDTERLAASEKKAKEAKKLSISISKSHSAALQENEQRQRKLSLAHQEAIQLNKKLKENLAIQSTELNNNRVKIKNLRDSLKKANMTFKDAGVNLKTVKLALDGNTRALSAMTQATKLATAGTKRLRSGLFSITNEGRLLSNTFATVRSKLLLYSFGASVVSKVLVDQVKAFAQQEESVQRLADVFGGAGARRLDEYSSELQKNSTFGDENINVVMAQIGAFGASEEQTKKLTQATADLAAGMNIDLNTAGLLVAKTIGSSTNALSRYGILLDMTGSKSDKVAGLTESVQEKFGGLAAELARTTEGQLAQAQNAFGDAAEVIGEVLAPIVLGAANTFKKLSESLSTEKIYSLLTAVTAVGVAFTIYKAKAIAATIATKGLNAAMKKNLFGFAAAAVVLLLTKLIELTGIFRENTEEISDNAKKFAENGEEIGKYIKKVDDVNKGMQKKLALLKANTEIEKFAIQNGIDLADVNRELFFEIERLNKEKEEEKNLTNALMGAYKGTTKAKIEETEAIIAAADAKIMTIGLNAQEFEGYQALLEKLKELKKKYTEKTEATDNQILEELGLFNTISEIADREMELHRQVADSKIENINREEQRELEALRNTFAYKKSTDAQKEKLEQNILKKHEEREKKAKEAADRRMLVSFRAQQIMSINSIVMSTGEAIMKAQAQTGIFGAAWIPMIKALSAAQIGLVLAQSPPKMEYGGLVGGKPHSQGGTMIEAERGEYVLRKSAVDSIGLETLNKINAGMGGGSVNISFQGNVLSKDFIEDEAIPMIRDAIRRGEDIGLS
tara:strand:- start:7299 stop:9875 length:2577 start_codon:yes stop_codon:yes gene_type:complete